MAILAFEHITQLYLKFLFFHGTWKNSKSSKFFIFSFQNLTKLCHGLDLSQMKRYIWKNECLKFKPWMFFWYYYHAIFSAFCHIWHTPLYIFWHSVRKYFYLLNYGEANPSKIMFNFVKFKNLSWKEWKCRAVWWSNYA